MPKIEPQITDDAGRGLDATIVISATGRVLCTDLTPQLLEVVQTLPVMDEEFHQRVRAAQVLQHPEKVP